MHTLHKQAIGAASALVVLGCSGVSTQPATSVLDLVGSVVPTQADFDASMNRWVGRDEQAFSMLYGPPQSTQSFPDGRIDEWRWEGTIPVPITREDSRETVVVPVEYACVLRLQVDPQGRILRFTREGMSCIGEM